MKELSNLESILKDELASGRLEPGSAKHVEAEKTIRELKDSMGLSLKKTP